MSTTGSVERVVITGANTGIGRETALALARSGAHVLLACRSEERARPVVDEITQAGGRASFVALDLADLDDVRACAERLLSEGEPIDVLVNNAGLAGLRGTTRQGFEVTFGVNHLGHFALTRALLPLLERASERRGAPSRVVNVSSQAHAKCRRIDWGSVRGTTRSRTGLPEYEQSKLCNVLFSAELARRLGSGKVHSYALHPGVVASDVWRHVPWPARAGMKLFMIDNAQGAATSIHCASSDAAGSETGLYYDRCAPRAPSTPARDEALAAELWTRSEAWTAS